MNYKTLTLTLLLGLATHTGVQAEETMHHEGHDMSQMGDMDQMEGMEEMVMTKGVITRVDEANGKVGIKHEDIKNLKMPAMNMVFTLTDSTQLKGLKAGDAVNFHAEMQGGKLLVTKIQPQ